MPIILNNSNINIQYNTGSSYIIETVKSDLYVRDTIGTTSNLFAEPTVNPSISPVTTGNHKTLTFPLVHNIVAYYSFNNSSSLGIDSNPSSTKYNLTPTIVGGTGGYNTSISVEGASFQATNDGDYLEGSFPIRTIYDNSTSGISVSCWFYKKSGTTYDNSYNTFLYDFYTNPNDKTFAVSLGHYNGVHVINWAATYLTYGSETYCSGFGPVQTLDTWYHLVISFNKSGILKAYVNGINLNLSNTSGTPRISTSGSSVYPMPQFPNVSKLRIFNSAASGGSKFSGNVDEFYVFNKELSQAEITSLYNKTFSLKKNYKLEVQVDTHVKINNGEYSIFNGTYNILIENARSIITRGNMVIFNSETNTLDITYKTNKSITEINNNDTVSFRNIEKRKGIKEDITSSFYIISLGKKDNGYKKYKFSFYKSSISNILIDFYYINSNNTKIDLNNGSDYIYKYYEDETGVIREVILYVTINKGIIGEVYLKSSNIIHAFILTNANKTKFNNLTDNNWKISLDNRKNNWLKTLDDTTMFGVKKATDDKAAATAQIIKLNDSTTPISISYNSSTISRNSLDTLVTTFNNVNSFDETTVAGQLQSITNTHNFRDILSPITTNIDEYISYELATEKTPQTPTITSFNIKNTAQKYIYFVKL